MEPKSKSLKILFIPVDHFGHINPCIGIGEKLVAQGHRAIIALERSWKGKICSIYSGLEEVLYVDPTRTESSASANEHWLENIKSRASIFPLDAFEKLKQTNAEKAAKKWYILLNVDSELKRIIHEIKPDVIVVDCFVTVPAVYHSGIPWVRLFSGAPLGFVPSDQLPPAASGLPTNGDRTQWAEYRQLNNAVMQSELNKFHHTMQHHFNVPKPQSGSTAHHSPFLNIYAYPEELDYLHIRPLPEKFVRFDHFIRFSEADANFKVPHEFLHKTLGSLVYCSMGSMGSVDLRLMQRLIEMLSHSPNRFILSLGTLHEQLKLAPNMWGAKFVPQIDVLPLVDLVITHGGNNTVLEALYFCKPMIICPLFAEQPENAQRVSELGLGHRINAYTCETSEMVDKIEQLLSNQQLKARLAGISKRMQQSNSTEKAAFAITNIFKE